MVLDDNMNGRQRPVAKKIKNKSRLNDLKGNKCRGPQKQSWERQIDCLPLEERAAHIRSHAKTDTIADTALEIKFHAPNLPEAIALMSHVFKAELERFPKKKMMVRNIQLFIFFFGKGVLWAWVVFVTVLLLVITSHVFNLLKPGTLSL